MKNRDEQVSNAAKTATISREEFVEMREKLSQLEMKKGWLREHLKLSKKKLYGKSGEWDGEGVIG